MLTFVTATNRLARERQLQYDQLQLDRGLVAWESLDALSWSAWVKRLWHEAPLNSGQAPVRLLSTLEQESLWAKIIADDVALQDQQKHTSQAPLWNIHASARQAMLAWQLLKLWHIPLSQCQFSHQADHRSFSRWATNYEQTLIQSHWLDEVSLLCQLAAQPPQLSISVELQGFETLSPVQQNLITRLGEQGRQVSAQARPNSASSQVQLHRFVDQDEEWAYIGKWARDILEAESTQHPRIGIVTPDLDSMRDHVITQLQQQLSPGEWVANTEHTPAFHLSVGEALSRQPLIQAALALLAFCGEMDFETVSNGLTSPYTFTQSPSLAGFALELSLRRKAASQLDVYNCMQVCQLHKPPLPALKKALTRLQSLKKAAPHRQSYRQWAQFFNEWVSLAEWPGAGLSSQDYQLLEAWQGCLHQMSQLDQIEQPVRLHKARSVLQRLCQQNQFQAEAHPDTPIQVMGMLEASGFEFDYLWVAGLHEHAWPAKAHPNPFIPIRAQADAGWPAAKQNRHFELATQRLQQLFSAATLVQVSYAVSVENVEVSPSPLIERLLGAEVALKHGPSNNWLQSICQQAPALQSQEDHFAPAIGSDEAHRAHHGVGRIQAQAACPFQSLARYRLKATFETEPELGLDALDRGILLHAVLADFWQAIKNQATLQQCLSQHRLEASLLPIIDQHLLIAMKRSGLGEGFAEAEKQRLSRLIESWLHLELERAPFTVVAQEYSMQASINGLSCSFRIDRMDEIESGKLAVIDYKTGKASANEWCHDRPDSPQMPLYALTVAQKTPVNAVLFAQVRASEHTFSGIAEHEALLPGIKPPEQLSARTLVHQDLKSWAEAWPLWQRRMDILAAQHLSGEAQVDPKNATTCQYCELTSLCRVKQAAAT